METKGGGRGDVNGDDLKLLWCIDCLKCHGPDCPHHLGGSILVGDTPTVSHAVASLPRILDLQTIDGLRQVVANENIPRRTMFGPLEAPEAGRDRKEKRFALKFFKKDGSFVQLDTSDERRSNWMTLVAVATTTANQNLIVYQYKDALYFTVIRDIPEGEILRVWYAPNYAAQLGKPLLNDIPMSGDGSAMSTETATSDPPTAVDSTHVPVQSAPGDDIDTQVQTSCDGNTLLDSSDCESTASMPTCDTLIVSTTLESILNGSADSMPQTAQRRIATRSTTRKQLASTLSTKLQTEAKENTRASRPFTASPSSKRTCAKKTLRDGRSYNVPSTVDSETPDKDGLGTAKTSQEATGNRSSVDAVASPSRKLVSKGRLAKYVVIESKQTMAQEQLHSGDKQPQKAVKVLKKARRKCYQLVPKRRPEDVRSLGRSRNRENGVAKLPKRIRKEKRLPEDEYRSIQERIRDEIGRSCSECSLILEDGDQLKEHIRTEHHEDPIKCPACSKVCLTDQQLAQHVNNMHNESKDKTTTRSYECLLCDKHLFYLKSYQHHLFVFHSKTFDCSVCRRKFWNRSKYLLHIEEHKLQGEQVETGEMFTCEKCGREFTSMSGLGIHQSMKHMDKSFKCSYCDYSSGFEITLQEHILLCHPENDLRIAESAKLTCNICNAVFLRTRTLNHHKKNHQKKEFKCKNCDAVYRRKETLIRHNCLTARRRTVTLDIVETDNQTSSMCDMFECQKCQKLFASLSSMKHHAKTHQDKHYTCDVCKKEFHKRFNFDTHKYQHLRVATNEDGSRELIQVADGPVDKHQCPLCKCHFMKMNPLIQHLQTYHESVTPDISECTPCQRMFLSPEELSSHVAGHTRIPLPKGMTLDTLNSCDVCGKVFKSSGELVSHATLHTGRKSHVCEVCGKTFRRADSLRSHRAARHAKDSRMLKCKICNKSFKSSCLRAHIQSHAEQRTYQCPHCDRAFSQRGNFNRHVILHTAEVTNKKLSCNICGRVFKQEDYLERHQLVHSEYAFPCTVCDKKFSTQHFLTNHVRKVHEAEESCQCEHCGTKFKYIHSYRKHMTRKHPDVGRADYQPGISNMDIESLQGIMSSLIASGNEGSVNLNS